jgi:hypothetical protein
MVEHTEDDQVTVTITQKIWDNTRDVTRRIPVEHEALYAHNEGGGLTGGPTLGLMHKQLERDRGFFIYVSQAYLSMVPYIKGISIPNQGIGHWGWG